MADSPPVPRLTTAPPDAAPNPHRNQPALEQVAKLPENSYSTLPMLTPAPKFSEENSKRWIPCHPPPQPEPQSNPLPGKLYPNAVPGQQIQLDGLSTDVLMVIISHIYSIEDPGDPGDPRDTPISSFDFRKKGSTVFCLSLVNKRLRTVTIPTLFQNVFRYSISMSDLNRRLRDIEGNPLLPFLPPVLSTIKVCDIVTTSLGNITACRTRLAKTLPRMNSLTELSITNRKDVDISGLQVTFQREEVTLPSITHLRILSQGSWEFLVKACPNVEILSLARNLHHEDLLTTAGELKSLKHLEICSDSWRKAKIERLHRFVPRIHRLTLRGSIGQECIEGFVDAFSSFRELTELFMTTAQQITDVEVEAEGSDDFPEYDTLGGQASNICDGCILDIANKYVKDCRTLKCLVFACIGHGYLCCEVSDRSKEPMEPIVQYGGRAPAIMDLLDWEGFPDVFSFSREVYCGDDRLDPPFSQTKEDEDARVETAEYERYDGIKQEAMILGLWN